jgi:hypothetical protein
MKVARHTSGISLLKRRIKGGSRKRTKKEEAHSTLQGFEKPLLS